MPTLRALGLIFCDCLLIILASLLLLPVNPFALALLEILRSSFLDNLLSDKNRPSCLLIFFLIFFLAIISS